MAEPAFEVSRHETYFEQVAAKSQTGFLIVLRVRDVPGDDSIRISPGLVGKGSTTGMSSASQKHELVFDDPESADDDLVAYSVFTSSPRSSVEAVRVWIRSEEGSWQEFHRTTPIVWTDKAEHGPLSRDTPVAWVRAVTGKSSKRYLAYEPRERTETGVANEVRAIVANVDGDRTILRSDSYSARTFFLFQDSKPIAQPADSIAEVIFEQRPLSNIYLSNIAMGPVVPFSFSNWRTDERVQLVLIGVGGVIVIAIGFAAVVWVSRRGRVEA